MNREQKNALRKRAEWLKPGMYLEVSRQELLDLLDAADHVQADGGLLMCPRCGTHAYCFGCES